MGHPTTAQNVNTLVRFLARRDAEELTPELIGGRADVAILFGGSILAGAAVFADAMRASVADFYLIVGGEGHSTGALRERMRERTGWRDADAMTEAALFDRYLREHEGVEVDALEERSTNCGNNVMNALALLRDRGIAHDRIVIVQDATMQLRMDAGFRRHGHPGMQLVNFASHRTMVRDIDHDPTRSHDDDAEEGAVDAEAAAGTGAHALEYVDPADGIWDLDHYVSLLLGEIPRLTDDEEGYGPAGRDFIAHVDVPDEVRWAFDALRGTEGFGVRKADRRWADA